MSFEQDVYNRYCEKIAALAEKVAAGISQDPNDPSNRGSAYTNRLQDLAARTRSTFANIGNNQQQAPAQKPSPYMSQQDFQTMYGGGQTQKSAPKAKSNSKAKSSKNTKSSKPASKPAPKQQSGAGAGAVRVQTPSIMALDQRPQVSVNPGLPGMPPVNLPKDITQSPLPTNIGDLLRSGAVRDPNEAVIGPARRAYNEDGSLFYDPETGYAPQGQQQNNGPTIAPSMDAMIPGVFSASPAPQPASTAQQAAPEQSSQLSGSLSPYLNSEVALYGNHDNYNEDRFRALAETGM